MGKQQFVKTLLLCAICILLQNIFIDRTQKSVLMHSEFCVPVMSTFCGFSCGAPVKCDNRSLLPTELPPRRFGICYVLGLYRDFYSTNLQTTMRTTYCHFTTTLLSKVTLSVQGSWKRLKLYSSCCAASVSTFLLSFEHLNVVPLSFVDSFALCDEP